MNNFVRQTAKKNFYIKWCCFALVLMSALSSCTTSRFISAADMYDTYGTINKVDGTSENGYFINLSADIGSYGVLYCDHESKKENDYVLIPFRLIKNIEIEKAIFEPRLLALSSIGDNKYVMLKRLTPLSFTKLGLYELDYDESDRNIAGAHTQAFAEKKYYLQLPDGPNAPVCDVDNAKITEQFDLKMSAMLADCPALAAKIKRRDKGYFLGRIHTADKAIKVLSLIIAEYNACK